MKRTKRRSKRDADIDADIAHALEILLDDSVDKKSALQPKTPEEEAEDLKIHGKGAGKAYNMAGLLDIYNRRAAAQKAKA
jgi:hypothetical protein